MEKDLGRKRKGEREGGRERGREGKKHWFSPQLWNVF